MSVGHGLSEIQVSVMDGGSLGLRRKIVCLNLLARVWNGVSSLEFVERALLGWKTEWDSEGAWICLVGNIILYMYTTQSCFHSQSFED